MGNSEVSSPVTKELTADEIEAMENVAIDSFDVSNEDVTAVVSYIATGSMQLSIPEDISENEIADALTSTIANLLGIHPRDVSITDVNLETGEVQYEVSSNEFEDISTVQEALESLSNDDIESSIQDVLPEVEVERNDVDDDIAVDVTIIVDGSNAGSISDARTDVNDIFTDLGYDVTSDVTIVTPRPSLSPSFTTLIPSSAPSITGIVVTLKNLKKHEFDFLKA